MIYILTVIVPKPGNSSHKPKNFRLITPPSGIRTFFENLIKLRSKWWCEHHSMFDSPQFGFRKGQSTTDDLYVFTLNTMSSYSREESNLAILLDISLAYDNMIISILLYWLVYFKLPTNINTCMAPTHIRKSFLFQVV